MMRNEETSFTTMQATVYCDDLNAYLINNLEMVPNARDLGGVRTVDGRVVKKGKLLRSGMLAHASDSDLDYLHNVLGVSLVIDLRTAYEVSKTPDKLVVGARCMNMPVQDKRNNMWQAMASFPGTEPERLQAFARTDKGKEMTRKMYIGFLSDEYCQLQFAAFLELLATQRKDRTILWHCSQGKDRTGICCSLLLFALGCDRATVVKEFSLTNDFYRDMIDMAVEQLKANGGTDEDATVIESILGVKIDYFEAALDYVDATYGSMDNYLHDVLLLSVEDREALRNNFLE